MQGKTCPFLENCFIIGSLKALDIPDLINYCSHNYESCRYYRSQLESEKKGCEEIMV